MKRLRYPCAGFQENVVLALKSCFYEEEIRCLRIEKLPDQPAVYHARTCTDLVQLEGFHSQKISPDCNDWFNSLVSTNFSDSNISLEMEGKKDNFDLDLAGEPQDFGESKPKSPLPHQDTNSHPSNIEYNTSSEGDGHYETLPEKDEVDVCQEFKCLMCDLSFRKKPSLNKHINRKHKEEFLKLRIIKSDYSCDKCGKVFHKLPSLRRHYSRNHAFRSMGKDYLTCVMEGCVGPAFTSEMAMKDHMKEVHNLPRKGRKPTEPLDLDLLKTLELDTTMKDQLFITPKSCPECSKIFESKLKLYWHIKRVHQQKHKPCQHCGLMVKKLSDHVKRQHTEKDVKNFVCEFCGERFKGLSGYQFHIDGHTGEKKYSCRSCGKQFRTSSESYNCERGHQDIFKWRCSLCNFKSHQKNKYVRHLRTHTKSQPYQCPLCDRKAARKDYLQKHIEKSHGQMTLKEVEAKHPNLYKIEEKVQVTADMPYQTMNLSIVTKRFNEEEHSEPHSDKENKFSDVDLKSILKLEVKNAEKNCKPESTGDYSRHHTFAVHPPSFPHDNSGSQPQPMISTQEAQENLVQQLSYLTKLSL